MRDFTVKIVELQGNHYKIGNKQSVEIQSTPQLMNQIRLLEHLSLHSNAQKAKELLQTNSPCLLEELKGLADGMNMELNTIIKLYSGYEVNFPAMGCTALIKDNQYARNYDFSPDLYDARLVFSNPTNGYANVGFSQQVIGRLDGMNETGLVVGLHFVNNAYRSKGFIATTIVRMLLEQCSCIDEALQLIKSIPHGYCYNFSIMDASGEAVIVEASPREQFVHVGTQLICTNHFRSEKLLHNNRKDIQGSVTRLEYLTSLLKKEQPSLSLYRHFNNGDSPLFFKHYKEYFGTLHTVVYLPKELSLIVGVGENCKPMSFSLREFLGGTVKLPQLLKGKISDNEDLQLF